MLYLKLLSVIASIFAIYPLQKLFRKDEINVFDLIILFHTIFFCIVPLVSDYSTFLWLDGFNFEQDIIFRIFIYYVLFIGAVFGIDLFWTKYYKNVKSLINITYYLNTLPKIDISWIFLFILGVNLIISWLWYLPQASYMDTFEKYSQLKGYESSPLYLFYGSVFTMCISFSLILFLKNELTSKKKNILLVFLFGFGILLLFLPRRIMLFYFIIGLITTYSIKREFFSFKSIFLIGILVLFIIKIYFPFYNVMRWTSVKIDGNNFATSIINILGDTGSKFEENKKHAKNVSEGRALNLYYALYRIVKYDTSPDNGKLLIAAIDHAIPKLLNPNKGKGTELILQKKMRCNTDQADSILLLSYGDFGFYLGPLYSVLLFLLIICIYVLLYRCNYLYLNNGPFMGVMLIIYLISMSWNVEAKLDGYFASYIHLILISVILFLMDKFKIYSC